MGKRPPTFIERALFDGGYREVTLEITVHLGGTRPTTLIGWDLKDTATGDQIGIEAFETDEMLLSARETTDRIHSLCARALACLDPF